MFREVEKNLFSTNNFIYRIHPEDYISITKSLLLNKKFFTEVNRAKESFFNSNQIPGKNILSVLKRWKDTPGDYKIFFEDFDTYRYFYKEVGASLKFNPLSDKNSGNHLLEKILEFLYKYIHLIVPKAIYTMVDVESTPEGLNIKGKEIHFNSKKLKIFSSHSNLKSEKEISPEEFIKEKVVVYVVTIGHGLDDEVKSLADKGEVFDAYLLNGIGAGAAEMTANDLNLYMNDNCEKNNSSYKRLSPGYGDWPVTDQEKIFKILNPEKNIGVVLTDSHIMLPEKSTSGIMGLIK